MTPSQTLLQQVGSVEVPPGEGALDTPEKVEAYQERMEAALRAPLAEIRRARAESWIAARSRWVG